MLISSFCGVCFQRSQNLRKFYPMEDTYIYFKGCNGNSKEHQMYKHLESLFREMFYVLIVKLFE